MINIDNYVHTSEEQCFEEQQGLYYGSKNVLGLQIQPMQ